MNSSSRGCRHVGSKLVFQPSQKWLIDQPQIDADLTSLDINSILLHQSFVAENVIGRRVSPKRNG